MVGFRGLELDDSMPILDQLRSGQVGGVILHDLDVQTGAPGRNISSEDQVRSLVGQLREAGRFGVLIALDQEGGRVARLNPANGFPPTLSQQELGSGAPSRTLDQAVRTAATLAELGIDLNLAPVVDLNINPESPGLGTKNRSFSPDPETVTEHARAVVLGHAREGVVTALKHFPGQGSASLDSHLELPDVTDTWSPSELHPYQELLSEGIAGMVITAHVMHRGLDPHWPATLSPAIITGILRDRLGFDGMVMTDDLQMGAVARRFGLESAVRQALLAGVDILLFGNNNPLAYEPEIAPRVIEVILGLLQDGVLTEDRIDESVERIASSKGGEASRR